MSAGGFLACDVFVQAREGGFQDNPSDEGNWLNGVLIGTNRGISAPVLAAYLGHPPTPMEMQALDASTAQAIRKANYWAPIGGEILAAGVDLLVYDDAVNRGVYAAATALQGALGVTQDGMVGPVTAAAASASVMTCMAGTVRAQIAAYAADAAFATFGRGWLSRVGTRLRAATERSD